MHFALKKRASEDCEINGGGEGGSVLMSPSAARSPPRRVSGFDEGRTSQSATPVVVVRKMSSAFRDGVDGLATKQRPRDARGDAVVEMDVEDHDPTPSSTPEASVVDSSSEEEEAEGDGGAAGSLDILSSCAAMMITTEEAGKKKKKKQKKAATTRGKAKGNGRKASASKSGLAWPPANAVGTTARAPRGWNISFPFELQKVLQSGEFVDVLRWTADGEAFQVHDFRRLESDVIPACFNKNTKDFDKSLRLWGFKRRDKKPKKGSPPSSSSHEPSSHPSWCHPHFLRDKPELLPRMAKVSKHSGILLGSSASNRPLSAAARLRKGDGMAASASVAGASGMSAAAAAVPAAPAAPPSMTVIAEPTLAALRSMEAEEQLRYVAAVGAERRAAAAAAASHQRTAAIAAALQQRRSRQPQPQPQPQQQSATIAALRRNSGPSSGAPHSLLTASSVEDVLRRRSLAAAQQQQPTTTRRRASLGGGVVPQQQRAVAPQPPATTRGDQWMSLSERSTFSGRGGGAGGGHHAALFSHHHHQPYPSPSTVRDGNWLSLSERGPAAAATSSSPLAMISELPSRGGANNDWLSVSDRSTFSGGLGVGLPSLAPREVVRHPLPPLSAFATGGAEDAQQQLPTSSNKLARLMSGAKDGSRKGTVISKMKSLSGKRSNAIARMFARGHGHGGKPSNAATTASPILVGGGGDKVAILPKPTSTAAASPFVEQQQHRARAAGPKYRLPLRRSIG